MEITNSKASMLNWLSPKLKIGIVPRCEMFTVKEYTVSPLKIIKKVQKSLGEIKVAVRSSSREEDGEFTRGKSF